MSTNTNTNTNFERQFTGWTFLIAAILLWCGYMLSSHHIGEYIVVTDFEAIGENVWYWIWMYRIHIFGWVTMGIAMFAFVSLTAREPYRILILPGAGLVIIGTFSLAIASAYYYNHGAWGVGQIAGKTSEEVDTFMNNLLFTNQYVTCFIRFGRIFSGVGLALLGASFVKWKILDNWLAWFTIILGVLAVGIILVIPDNFEIYKPLFHVKVLWLVTMGLLILKKGVCLTK